MKQFANDMQSWACESKSKRAQSIQDVVPCVPEKFTDFASLIPGVEDRMVAIFQHCEDEGIKKPEFLLFRKRLISKARSRESQENMRQSTPFIH